MRPCIQKQRGGRPAKMSATDKRTLIRLVTSGAADTAVQLQNEFRNTIQIQVSTQTLRNALKSEGMKSAVKQKKQLINATISSNGMHSLSSTNTGLKTIGNG